MVVTSLFPKKQTCSGGSETIDGRRSLEFRGSRKTTKSNHRYHWRSKIVIKICMLDFCTRSCILFSLSSFLDNILFFPYGEYMLRCLQPHWGVCQTYTCHLCPRCTKSGPKTLDLLAGSIRFSDGATQIGWDVANTFYSKTGQSRSP